jgi:hypothetical protein
MEDGNRKEHKPLPSKVLMRVLLKTPNQNQLKKQWPRNQNLKLQSLRLNFISLSYHLSKELFKEKKVKASSISIIIEISLK